jgi:hypothetical protein
MSYLLLKWLHIVSSTVLLGTGAGIAFFMRRVAGGLSPQLQVLVPARLAGLCRRAGGVLADGGQAIVRAHLTWR